MIIRLAQKEDQEQIILLLDELIAEANKVSGQNKPFESEAMRKKLFNDILQREDVKIFVAEHDGILLAIADLFILPIMRRGYYQGHIEDFVVTETMRGKGVGTKLFDAIKNYCREHTIKVIKLSSSLELVNAHQFYIKNGGEFTEKLFRFDLS
jgi:GNAT superfamily N-acetyltransferase